MTSSSSTLFVPASPKYMRSPCMLTVTPWMPYATASSSASLRGSGSMTSSRTWPSDAATYWSSISRTRSPYAMSGLRRSSSSIIDSG